MYHPTVVERNIARHYDEHKIELKYYSDAHIAEWSAHIASLYDKDGQRTRVLQPEESAFIRNEITLSALDFAHWAEHYCHILLDSGGLGTLKLWGSQKMIMDVIAALEFEMFDRALRGERCNGILIALNKARQLGGTMLAQSLGAHKLTLNKHIRGLVASINDDKVMIPVSRFERILANLPQWLRPSVGYHEKKGHITFDKLDSAYYIQDFNQMSGLGQGDQYEFGHLTEVASASNPLTIEHDFFPTIPQSARALHILESTPQGRGNWWHTFTEGVRNGEYYRWRYVFIPWYAEEGKYSRPAPVTWIPSDAAILHEKKVYATSPEFCAGRHHQLTRDQLYWWETERSSYAKRGTLNLFLTNYASTPEESFQHSSQGAFDHATLDQLRTGAAVGALGYTIGLTQ